MLHTCSRAQLVWRGLALRKTPWLWIARTNFAGNTVCKYHLGNDSGAQALTMQIAKLPIKLAPVTQQYLKNDTSELLAPRQTRRDKIPRCISSSSGKCSSCDDSHTGELTTVSDHWSRNVMPLVRPCSFKLLLPTWNLRPDFKPVSCCREP